MWSIVRTRSLIKQVYKFYIVIHEPPQPVIGSIILQILCYILFKFNTA